MNLMRLAIFLSLVVLIFFTQRFWFLGAWHWIATVHRPVAKNLLQVLWFVALIVFVTAFLDPMLGRPFSRVIGGKWIVAVARVWLFASFFAFLAVKFVGALGWFSGTVLASSNDPAFNPSRRDFFRYATYFAGSLPFLAATYGFAAGRLKFRVERVEVPITNFPKELDGLKIVQLSDIHIGDFMPREEVRRAVDLANSLNADMAVVTGDFISSQGDPLEDCVAELSQLRAPLGIWGCNGNHEIYADAEESAQQLFQQHGMKLLRQERVELDWHGGKFNLVGVDYQRDHMTRGPSGPMLQGLEPLLRREVPNILLSHNPNSFRRAAELGIELSLAGHTHGGQVKIEIVDHNITPARLITDFPAGLYHLPMGNGASNNGRGDNTSGTNPGGTAINGSAVSVNGNNRKSFLYVNRGLGTFAMPVRIGVPPEITLLTLRAV